MDDDFAGKLVYVTGASRGLGAECARFFARCGATVVMFGRDEQALRSVLDCIENGVDHQICVLDFRQSEVVAAALTNVLTSVGPPDVVVHAAGGGLGLRQPLLTRTEFLSLFDTNLLGAVGINEIVVPKMIERGSGVIIHVGSTASTQAIGSVGYNTVKAALAAYVRSLGRALAETGVNVTGINPGAFHTVDNAMGRLETVNPAAFNIFVETKLPRGKMGEASEVVNLIGFLASSKASMMAGCMVPIDAGEGYTYEL